jgi:hypothetical protein
MGMPSQRSVSATALLLSRIRALPITGGYDAPVPGAAAQIIRFGAVNQGVLFAAG